MIPRTSLFPNINTKVTSLTNNSTTHCCYFRRVKQTARGHHKTVIASSVAPHQSHLLSDLPDQRLPWTLTARIAPKKSPRRYASFGDHCQVYQAQNQHRIQRGRAYLDFRRVCMTGLAGTRRTMVYQALVETASLNIVKCICTIQNSSDGEDSNRDAAHLSN